MQRPRRTSEFHDDSSGIRHQPRAQQRSTIAPSPHSDGAAVVGTAKKFSSRQSRIAVPNRPSSSDRVGSINNAFANVPSAVQRGVPNNGLLAVPSSSVKCGITPQKTPLKKSTNRVLFTIEKQRSGSGKPVPLHNDKKWVQEQTQRITEHLLEQGTLAGGISTDFLSRGMRQMSIKQFVAIINYFLGYIWGNRYTVTVNNHVEDIIGILQKLQYPQPVNKSWLKTPNTQHSFGNIIVLLDFLMDFVPATDEQVENSDFPLKNHEELTTFKITDELFQMPDIEFQQALLKNCAEGFPLWDTEKEEEFNCLQHQTCNLLIQKVCDGKDLEMIDREIQILKENFKTLEKERPPEDKVAMKKKAELSHELENIIRNIKSLNGKCENNERDLKYKNSRTMAIAKEVENVERDIKFLQEILTQQRCTVEERDQLINDVSHYKQMLGIEKRAIQDLEGRSYNQQIQFSKVLKQFTDQVEAFNNRTREIKFSDLITSKKIKYEDLELSLRPAERQMENLTKIIPLLKLIKQKTLERIENTKNKILRIQQHYKQLTDDLDTKLHPKLNALHSANTLNSNSFQKLQQHLKENELKLSAKIQELETKLLQAVNIKGEFMTLINQKKSQVEELTQQNELTMQQAEEKHKQCVEQRKSYLDAYDKMLEDCIQNDGLLQLKQQVEMQEKQLGEFKKSLTNAKN